MLSNYQFDVDSNRILRNISFGMLAVSTAVMAVLTVGIHFGWSESLYTSWPLIALWVLTAAGSAVFMIRRRLYRNPVVFLLHVSLLIILVGGCVTHFCSETGSIHLRAGDSPVKNVLSADDEDQIVLPEGIILRKFEVITYPTTDTPRDYVCGLASENGLVSEASMNNPANMLGYTFIMESYDDDGNGVTFNVSRDVWGIGITYAGYILLTFSFIAYFFVKNSSWRLALKHLSVLIFLLLAIPMEAKVSKEFSNDFGRVLVNYKGRICPMATVAKDFTSNLTGGSASYDGCDMQSVLAGFVFDFSDWKRKPIIRIKNDELRHILGLDGKYVSYEQFFNAVSSGKIDLEDTGTRRKFSVEIDRFETINMLVSGEILKIFPIADDTGNITWLSPTDNIPAYIEGDQWLFIRKYLGLLNEQVQRNDTEQQVYLLVALKKYQHNLLGDEMPSDSEIRTEQCYDYLSSLRFPPVVVGLVGLILFLLSMFRQKSNTVFRIAGLIFAIIVALFLSCMIVMRWMVSGHVPLSNGYETMQFLSWILLVIAVVFWKRHLVLPMGILASGLALGVAVMGGSGSSISGLMPVLDSPLLSIHVMLVMMSYALFLLMALTGVAGLISGRNEISGLGAMVNVMLYPAVAFLATGIFVGAVWANVSWGRYWGWDPKEVWALITLLIYSFAVHPGLLPLFRKPRVMMWFSVIAFISVLITYFGVNFVLGGLHSYA